jgi:hypothetical protein
VETTLPDSSGATVANRRGMATPRRGRGWTLSLSRCPLRLSLPKAPNRTRATTHPFRPPAVHLNLTQCQLFIVCLCAHVVFVFHPRSRPGA